MAEKVRIIEKTRVVIGLILIAIFPILMIIMTLSAMNWTSTLKVMTFWISTTLLGLVILPYDLRLQIVRKENELLPIPLHHRKTSNKSYRCKICNQVFKDYRQLGGHAGKHKGKN